MLTGEGPYVDWKLLGLLWVMAYFTYQCSINIGKHRKSSATPMLFYCWMFQFTQRRILFYSNDFCFVGKPFHTWISVCGTRTQTIVFVLTVNIPCLVSTEVELYFSCYVIVSAPSCCRVLIVPIMNKKFFLSQTDCLMNCLAGCSKIV